MVRGYTPPPLLANCQHISGFFLWRLPLPTKIVAKYQKVFFRVSLLFCERSCRINVFSRIIFTHEFFSKDLGIKPIVSLTLYGGLDKGDIKEIQVLQNKAAQVVTYSPPFAERSPMNEKLKWFTVNQLIYYRVFKKKWPFAFSKNLCQNVRFWAWKLV